jgi:ketosteroid isomerase-like protein
MRQSPVAYYRSPTLQVLSPSNPRSTSAAAHRLRLGRTIAIASCILAMPIGSTALGGVPNDIPRIRSVLRAQQEAWNRGDIDGFMNGYWRSDETVFVSSDEVIHGWQKVLDRYKAKYSDRTKMGTLTFSYLEITPLSNDSAVALGSWKLKRENDEPHGRFTLIFRKFSDGWKIIHDHTSAAEKK